MTPLRYHAAYMEYAKTRPHARFDLAGSNILACTIDDLPGAREDVSLSGDNDTGYAPLVEAIAGRYGSSPSQVTTATGTAGANFFALAALVEPGDDVLIERPGYDPLMGAARLLGARAVRFDRTEASGFALDPERVGAALTPRTRAIVLTHPHNPTGVAADERALVDIAEIARRADARIIVDEVYRDVSPVAGHAFATRDNVFVTTNSLTKSYGLSGLRCGWVIASDEISYRVRRVRDVVDGTGAIVAERLATLAFANLDTLAARARNILVRNKTLVDDFLTSRPELRWAPSAGTVVFPRIEGVDDIGEFADRLLHERETGIVPGRFFDAPAHFRLGFGGDTDRLRSGLEQIAAALDAR